MEHGKVQIREELEVAVLQQEGIKYVIAAYAPASEASVSASIWVEGGGARRARVNEMYAGAGTPFASDWRQNTPFASEES